MKRLIAILLVVLSACTPYTPPTQIGNFQIEDPDYCLVVVFDRSGSYEGNDKAWDQLNAMIRRFFRDRVAENDRIVIAQISSAPRGPIWSGSPKAFRAQFGSRSAFENLLKAYKGSSRVFDSCAEAADYAIPMMGKKQAMVAIFSDMEDNLSAPGGEQRLVQSLKAFSDAGGAVGIYWCSFREANKWRTHLKNNVKRYVLTTEIDADPVMPSWD